MQPPFPAPVSNWHNDTYDAISPSRPELSVAGKTIVIIGAVSYTPFLLQDHNTNITITGQWHRS
jgi:hypothetical protein